MGERRWATRIASRLEFAAFDFGMVLVGAEVRMVEVHPYVFRL